MELTIAYFMIGWLTYILLGPFLIANSKYHNLNQTSYPFLFILVVIFWPLTVLLFTVRILLALFSSATFTEICVWPDGDWCYAEDIDQYFYKSNNYRHITLTTNKPINHEDVELIVNKLITEGKV